MSSCSGKRVRLRRACFATPGARAHRIRIPPSPLTIHNCSSYFNKTHTDTAHRNTDRGPGVTRGWSGTDPSAARYLLWLWELLDPMRSEAAAR
jgi:hypothetical protein